MKSVLGSEIALHGKKSSKMRKKIIEVVEDCE
jgi:hypothetical protein